MGLVFEPLDVGSAIFQLNDDVDASPEGVNGYVHKHSQSYRRMPISNALGYVAQIPLLAQKVETGIMPDRKLAAAYYGGCVLALRAILMSRAAKIGLRMGLSDVDPAVFIDNSKSENPIVAQRDFMTERSQSGLNDTALLLIPLNDWSASFDNGDQISTAAFSSGFGYTIESARIAADARVDVELTELLLSSIND